MIKSFRALGITSSPSTDEIGLSLILTDGVDVFEFIANRSTVYDEKESIVEIIEDFIKEYGPVDVIGIENHVADIAELSKHLGIEVVGNFRKSGGVLIAPYYVALSGKAEKPIAIVNIGGISSITWIGSQGEMLSFDCGPGNAAINRWVNKHAGMKMDYNGKLAITGKIDAKVLSVLMKHKYLALYPPKSASSETFEEKLENLEGLSLENGAATVTAFVAEAIIYSMLMYLPEQPKRVIICGGGSENPTLLRFIRQRLVDVDSKTVSELGYSVVATAAGAFAFLAVRRKNLLPDF